MAAKSGETSTTTTMEKLPHELVADILSRLPVLHLWTLRSVSKSWFRLITRNPQLAKSVFDTSKSNPSFILSLSENKGKFDFYMTTNHTECDKAIELKLPFLSDRKNPACYGICNGMLCLSNEDKREVYIWNPLTNDHITIPYPATQLLSSKKRQSTVFGFGYLQSVNEYKIIKLVTDRNWGELEWRTELSVYTLGKVSYWRIITEDLPFDFAFKGMPCPQINGEITWLARRDGELRMSTLLVFDLKDESLYEVQRPPINDRSDLTSILDLGGSPCLFNANNSRCVDMWMMKLDGGKYCLDKPYHSWKTRSCWRLFSIDTTRCCCLEWRYFSIEKSDGIVYIYNVSTKSINPLKEFCCPLVNAFAFAGSIISPRAINGAGKIWEERGL